MHWSGIKLGSVVATVRARPGPVRIVAVDGRGGAGKTSFAAALAEAAGGVPVVHTDDFAAAANGGEWWPSLLEAVIEPLIDGRPAAVDAAPVVIVEGVSAGRREWAHLLSFVIWMEAPAVARQDRVLQRDGHAAADTWDGYEAEEDAFFAADPVAERADLVISTG